MCVSQDPYFNCKECYEPMREMGVEVQPVDMLGQPVFENKDVKANLKTAAEAQRARLGCK